MSNQKELVAPEPHNCPGTESENAGKSNACQGCPNQQICSSNKQNVPDPGLFFSLFFFSRREKKKNKNKKILLLFKKD